MARNRTGERDNVGIMSRWGTGHSDSDNDIDTDIDSDIDILMTGRENTLQANPRCEMLVTVAIAIAPRLSIWRAETLQGNKTAMATETAKVAEKVTPTALAAVLEKKGKFVVDMASPNTTDEMKAAIRELLAVKKSQGVKVIDWTAKAPNDFTIFGVVNVDADDKPEFANTIRLVAVPSEAAAFADPIVRARTHKQLIGRIISRAADNDAEEADFVIASGTFRQGFDKTAFTFQAASVISTLKALGLAGINSKSLLQACENALFAKANFPRMPEAAWERIINLMIANATERNLDTSIFAHWLATRNAKPDTGAEISLGAFEEAARKKLAEREAKENAGTAAAQIGAADPTANENASDATAVEEPTEANTAPNAQGEAAAAS